MKHWRVEQGRIMNAMETTDVELIALEISSDPEAEYLKVLKQAAADTWVTDEDLGELWRFLYLRTPAWPERIAVKA